MLKPTDKVSFGLMRVTGLQLIERLAEDKVLRKQTEALT
jgi:hypothetical protein